MPVETPLRTPPAPPKRELRRAAPDHSQAIRRSVQLAFLALNLWIAAEFYLFVRYFETAGTALRLSRPPGVEGWLPVAAMMNLKALLVTGQFPVMHAAGMFLLAAFMLGSWLFRKSFCGWLCPVGTVSEYLWRLGRSTFGRNFRVSRKTDLALRSVKYLLLALFLYAVGSMSAPAIRAFLDGPYGTVADVKMLNFFRYLGLAGATVVAALALVSVFVQNFWCRYLCPYGALLGLFSTVSPLRIRRNTDLCIDCAKCAKACPSVLPVDRLVTIRSAECTGCMQCVASCPAAGALMMSAPRKRRVPAWVFAAGALGVFFSFYLCARVTGHWHTSLPDSVYFDLIPRASEFTHP
jgi:polyferredoxin